jgi:hypothetical protein
MALTITNHWIRSPQTPHFARQAGPANAPGGRSWIVTWLPDRALTRDQAEAAMNIAKALGQIPANAGLEAFTDAFWAKVEAWSAELGIAGATAIVQVSAPPEADVEVTRGLTRPEWEAEL